MKRIAVILALIGCAAVVAILGTAASDDAGGAYKVRAIFDSAFSVIPGEDVKIAGVKVGKIESLDVTPDKKAAVVLRIDKPGFGNFRKDATCIIRPQSLIGEKFVECTPTQPRPPGDEAPPPLQRIDEGAGRGEYLLPVTNTQRTVDIDLINNITRLPERQRLSIILNELGTGLAGRGADLNAVIKRADPALMETDRVLAILKDQNKVLADLARDSDTSLAPLASRRNQVADFIVKARNTAQATAERRGQLEQNFQRLPAFLAQLRPTLVRLGGLADQMSPVLEDLGAQAPNINRFIAQLGPFSQAARPAFSSLGKAANVGTVAVRESRPITQDIANLAGAARPVADDLASTLVSLRDTGGIERLMDYLFFQVSAINGFDSTGHYLRAELLVTLCSTYAIEKTVGCEATFGKSGGATARAASAGDEAGRSVYLKRQDALLRGASLKDVMARYPIAEDKLLTAGANGKKGDSGTSSAKRSGARAPLRMPASVLPSGGAGGSTPAKPQASTSATAPQSATTTGTQAPATRTQQAPGSQQTQSRLLDYLLGGGS